MSLQNILITSKVVNPAVVDSVINLLNEVFLGVVCGPSIVAQGGARRGCNLGTRVWSKRFAAAQNFTESGGSIVERVFFVFVHPGTVREELRVVY
jgi:hypothetical protein